MTVLWVFTLATCSDVLLFIWLAMLFMSALVAGSFYCAACTKQNRFKPTAQSSAAAFSCIRAMPYCRATLTLEERNGTLPWQSLLFCINCSNVSTDTSAGLAVWLAVLSQCHEASRGWRENQTTFDADARLGSHSFSRIQLLIVSKHMPI